jgi:hypothetical protein
MSDTSFVEIKLRETPKSFLELIFASLRDKLLWFRSLFFK